MVDAEEARDCELEPESRRQPLEPLREQRPPSRLVFRRFRGLFGRRVAVELLALVVLGGAGGRRRVGATPALIHRSRPSAVRHVLEREGRAGLDLCRGGVQAADEEDHLGRGARVGAEAVQRSRAVAVDRDRERRADLQRRDDRGHLEIAQFDVLAARRTQDVERRPAVRVAHGQGARLELADEREHGGLSGGATRLVQRRRPGRALGDELRRVQPGNSLDEGRRRAAVPAGDVQRSLTLVVRSFGGVRSLEPRLNRLDVRRRHRGTRAQPVERRPEHRVPLVPGHVCLVVL
mmetsp:Transcript_11781/g.37500  ORF Transcript_11781/g.37500 Transcript_11781/m.37500 type:complete len:292 (+) Transcript_11781:2602-3477(+)